MSSTARTNPANNFILVTPSDTVKINDNIPCSGILISSGSTTGTISVQDCFGNAKVLTGLALGVIHPIRTVRVNATDTTATGIIAFYN